LTLNSAHWDLALLAAGLAARGSFTALSAAGTRASTSALASRAASAAAASASISSVLLPSAICAAPDGGAGTRDGGANHWGEVSTGAVARERSRRPLLAKTCVRGTRSAAGNHRA